MQEKERQKEKGFVLKEREAGGAGSGSGNGRGLPYLYTWPIQAQGCTSPATLTSSARVHPVRMRGAPGCAQGQAGREAHAWARLPLARPVVSGAWGRGSARAQVITKKAGASVTSPRALGVTFQGVSLMYCTSRPCGRGTEEPGN